MKTFYAVCISSVLFLVAVTWFLRTQSTSFYGIAETKEIVLSSESPVEIKKIRVMPGQAVREGDTLVELSSQDLDLRISSISHELDEIKTKKSTHVTMSRAEVRQLNVQQEERANQIKAEIQQLEAQYQMNSKLVAELKSLKKDDLAATEIIDKSNPLVVRIENLKKDLAHIQDSAQILVDRLNSELSFTGDPLADEMRRLQEELKLLHEQKMRLFISAQISGIIGEVNFKDGEKVSPFTPIASLHSEAPSYIRGYIHENVYSSISMGQKVLVNSLAENSDGVKVIGEVVGVGSRIVEYPIRLRKIPEIQMWGREITIKIPVHNKFLLGEKVIIEPHSLPLNPAVGNPFESNVYAAGGPPAAPVRAGEQKTFSVNDITIAAALRVKKNVEASGVVYLADLDRYLIVSDETDGKRAALFLMDSAGAIDREVFVDGLKQINDMEAITVDEKGTIYIASSQSCNKEGALTDIRKLFIRVKRNGDAFSLDGKISLLDLLHDAARSNAGKDWAAYLLAAIDKCTVDIEGIACRAGDLYLGFKNPPLDKKSMVMKISNVKDLFSGDPLSGDAVSLWRLLPLTRENAPENAFGAISDMQFFGDTLYILSRTKAKDVTGRKTDLGGDLWKIVKEPGKLCNVRHFPGLKPEGIAFNQSRKRILITCDNGATQPSQFIVLKAAQ